MPVTRENLFGPSLDEQSQAPASKGEYTVADQARGFGVPDKDLKDDSEDESEQVS